MYDNASYLFFLNIQYYILCSYSYLITPGIYSKMYPDMKLHMPRPLKAPTHYHACMRNHGVCMYNHSVWLWLKACACDLRCMMKVWHCLIFNRQSWRLHMLEWQCVAMNEQTVSLSPPAMVSTQETQAFWCKFFELYRSFPALWKIKSE